MFLLFITSAVHLVKRLYGEHLGGYTVVTSVPVFFSDDHDNLGKGHIIYLDVTFVSIYKTVWVSNLEHQLKMWSTYSYINHMTGNKKCVEITHAEIISHSFTLALYKKKQSTP